MKANSKRAAGKLRPIVRPSLKPKAIDDNSWYYEYRGRIDVVVYITTHSGVTASRIVKIPWRKLERSLARCRPNNRVSGPRPEGVTDET
jgi:hypothetical protein